LSRPHKAEPASAAQRRLRLLALRARARRQTADDWIQVNCALFAQAQAQAQPAYAPWTELDARLQAWRAENRFDQFFFMRKPPGLRLRFSGAHALARLEPALVTWLEDAEQRNLIRSFRFARYEPEVFLFGGPTGIAIAHDQFDRDSRLAIRYEVMLESAATDVSRDQLSLALMNDLFARFVEDRAELWDIWQRIFSAHGRPALPHVDEIDVLPLGSLPGNAASLGLTGSADNAHIAARLHAAQVAGRLGCGPRFWLSQICTFHWNRLGLSLHDRVPLIASMLQLLDPHRIDA
jgi:thiopeptide-type bacteriocin biosynthesis protein